MIDVLLVQTGDRAEAETPRDALLAAVTMRAEAKTAGTFTGRRATVRFLVDGRMVAETSEAISVPAR